MNLKSLLFGVLWMVAMVLGEMKVPASARKQLTAVPTQVSKNRSSLLLCGSLLDANKKDPDPTMEIVGTRSSQSDMDYTLAPNTHQHKKPARPLSHMHVSKGRSRRWLALDQVDYLGPRTHPPTKPPRK